MLILLPPSEAKTAPPAGDPVDLGTLWLPGLAAARRRVLTRLVALCRRTSRRAVQDSLTTLGLSQSQHGELTRNAALPRAPAGPAAEVYTGVLYEALGVATLSPAARAFLDTRAAIFSGLWGAVRLGDRVPAYRCAVGVHLPAVGALSAFWRRALHPAVDDAAGDGPVLDLRSGAYAGMWAPSGRLAAHTASVRVLHERIVDGDRTRAVVSHFNKTTKGRLVRDLAAAGGSPASVDEIVAVWRDLAYTVEEQPAPPGRPRRLDVVVTEI